MMRVRAVLPPLSLQRTSGMARARFSLSARMAALALSAAFGLFSAPAHADIYGYVDSSGVPHLSTEKLDARYKLFMKGSASFDASDIPGGLSTAPGSASGGDSSFIRNMLTHPDRSKYDAMLKQAATEFSVDPALLKAIMTAESSFNTKAVSSKGAVGLMQIMPATAERYGVQGDRRKTIQQKLTDPRINIRLAARYLRDLLAMFPQRLELAIASYNAGEGAVQKYRNQIPPYPETQGYVQLVARFYQLYKPGENSAQNEPHRRLRITLPPARRNLPDTNTEGREAMPSAPAETSIE